MRQLPDSATIEDVVNTLENPIDYVRQVFGNMTAIRREHGSAVVSIGTTGRGIFPHYRVDPGRSIEAIHKMLQEEEGGEELLDAHFVAFHGRNHKQLDWGPGELHGEHWSASHMTWEEVRELLGRLRGYERR